MTRLKFNPEVSISHIILAVTFIVAAGAWKGGIENQISNEAHARESADLVFSERMENISRILSDIETRVKCNDAHRIKDEALWSD